MSRADELYTLIKEVFLLLDDGDRQLLSEYGLTVPRFYALFHLGDEPGLSVSRLSDLMFCDKSNVTRLIQGMESDDLVMRQPHEADRRALRLFLTPAGKSIREEVLAAHRMQNQDRFAVCLDEPNDDCFLRQLRALRESLQVDVYSATTY